MTQRHALHPYKLGCSHLGSVRVDVTGNTRSWCDIGDLSVVSLVGPSWMGVLLHFLTSNT